MSGCRTAPRLSRTVATVSVNSHKIKLKLELLTIKSKAMNTKLSSKVSRQPDDTVSTFQINPTAARLQGYLHLRNHIGSSQAKYFPATSFPPVSQNTKMENL